jgi:osmoprotectant transport system substrate-binding protein
MKKITGRFFLLMVALLLAVAPAPAMACVGKTLVVGSAGTPQQEILANILATLISERTGTSVKVVRFDSLAAAHQALTKADLDLFVNYTGVGQVQVLKKGAIADPAALYRSVKEAYAQDLNLVWLDPLGFDEPRVAPAGTVAQAAPVARKDTLKKFPALARLINKLGGAITPATMKSLESQTAGKSPQEVARGFLKAGRFI